jgi:hypothetical protein
MNKTKEHSYSPLPPLSTQGADGEEGSENESNQIDQKNQKPQKTKHDTEDKAEIPEPHSESKKTDPELFGEIREIYNTVLPELAKAEKVTAGRAKALGRRIMENPDRNQPAWWERFFSRVREYPWPMGDNPNNWRADFDWLIGESGMQKILEGTFRPFQRVQRTADRPVFGEGTAEGWALQEKYTHSGGLVDAKAMLRDIDAAECRQQSFGNSGFGSLGNFGNTGKTGIGCGRGNPV